MASNRIFCENCGAPNEADSRFCEGCGQPMQPAAAAASPASGSAPAPQPPPATPPPPASAGAAPAAAAGAAAAPRTNRAVLVVLAVVALAAVGYAYRGQISHWLGSGGGTGTVDSTATDSLFGGIIQLDSLHELGDTAMAQDTTLIEIPMVPPGSKVTVTRRPPETREPVPDAREQANRVTPPPPAPAPPAPAPVPAPAPAPTPPAPLAPPPSSGRIAAGSALALKTQSEVCTDKAKKGDRFSAVLQQDVAGSNGARIPAGTLVTFIVRDAKPNFEIAPDEVQIAGSTYRVSASVDSVAFKRKGRGLLGALAGAAAGAVVTTAAGGSAGDAVAGAAVGAAAGAMVGSQLKKSDGCIVKNGVLRITLREDIVVAQD